MVTASTLQAKVTERIRASFIDLIPEEQFKQLVERELATFQTPQRWRGEDHPSPLSALVRDEITARLKAQLKAELDKDEYKMLWTPYGSQAGEFLQRALAELTPALVQGLFAKIIEDTVYEVRSKLGNS